MTLHPSLGYTIITQELEERARLAELDRFIKEHPDQVLRPARGRWARLIHRILPARASSRSLQAPCETAS
ncbi:hypothetical protein [Microbacterium sp. SYP-A9085]|uniref:hypothetical protein n=1 Tax=Microbacterium sp. SYP-A9085 TaxID=2664454 RepID=UPI001562620A|nr:hypothetical protein [Microbacterium sp. SYP-A9085]